MDDLRQIAHQYVPLLLRCAALHEFVCLESISQGNFPPPAQANQICFEIPSHNRRSVTSEESDEHLGNDELAATRVGD